MSANGKTLVIRNGTLIDGTGEPASQNDAVVIDGNRISSVGALPPDLNLEDTAKYEVIDADGKWIMPGLIDGHCHLSFGFPAVSSLKYPSGRGTTNPGFSTLRAARNAQTVLRSGVTSISIPGGTWFIEVGVREAIEAGLLEGPRIYSAGRFIVTYGSIGDYEPSWVGTPEHVLGVLANDVNDMITEVRRQTKHGVDLDQAGRQHLGRRPDHVRKRRSPPSWPRPIAATPGSTIHSRGAGSTKAAAEAGRGLDHARRPGNRGRAVGRRRGRRPGDAHHDLPVRGPGDRKGNGPQRRGDWTSSVATPRAPATSSRRRATSASRCSAGTDSGNSPVMPYGTLHANEAEVLVKYGGYTPMEAIVANTRENAYAVGLEGRAGHHRGGQAGRCADPGRRPAGRHHASCSGGRHLDTVIKDGRRVNLHAGRRRTAAGSVLGVGAIL